MRHADQREYSSSVHSVGRASVVPEEDVPSVSPLVVASVVVPSVDSLVSAEVVALSDEPVEAVGSPLVSPNDVEPPEVLLLDAVSSQTQGANVMSSWQTWDPGVSPSHQHITDAPGTQAPWSVSPPSCGVGSFEQAASSAPRASILVQLRGLIGRGGYTPLRGGGGVRNSVHAVCRYLLRPPFAHDAVEALDDGRV